MKITITGLGWFGRSLGQALLNQHVVQGSTRSPEKKAKLEQLGFKTFLLESPQIPPKEILDTDVLLINFPPFLGLTEWLKTWPIESQTHVVVISSTSIYPDLPGNFTEDFIFPSGSKTSELYLEESWVQGLPHWTIIRFGGLFGPGRHPGHHLSGRKNIPGGKTPINLLQLEDAVNFTKLIIERKMYSEIFNLVAPEHPTREEYYTKFCQEQALPLPEFCEQDSKERIIVSDKAQNIYTFCHHLK